MYTHLHAGRFINGLFRPFDHLDALIVRWMCGHRFRATIYAVRSPGKSLHLY
jgi:hypothetical protein